MNTLIPLYIDQVTSVNALCSTTRCRAYRMLHSWRLGAIPQAQETPMYPKTNPQANISMHPPNFVKFNKKHVVKRLAPKSFCKECVCFQTDPTTKTHPLQMAGLTGKESLQNASFVAKMPSGMEPGSNHFKEDMPTPMKYFYINIQTCGKK